MVTCSLSVDYLRRPREVLAEVHRVLRPGGLACLAFTNRCFPTKVVPIWLNPFQDLSHIRIVGNYLHFSAPWADISVADVTAAGPGAYQDPMFVVQATK